ncbi:MAG: hypothetical protein COA44_14605 [Arcobacter sp.]|nr:MAG: hypothetical protein COA44_14605 [Arcobacter sp.]
MYTKIILSKLLQDKKADTWFFLAHGQDGSIYSYNTFSSVHVTDKKTMFSRLRGMLKDGLINTDYWRLL